MNELGRQIADRMDIVAYGPTMTKHDMDLMIDACKKYDIYACFGMFSFIPYIKEQLKGTRTKIVGTAGGMIGGSDDIECQVFTAKRMQELGCQEIEVVINLPYIKSGMYDEALYNLKRVREVVDGTFKVLIEAPVLTKEEMKIACELVCESGADYVKTGIGQLGPATLEMVTDMVGFVNGRCKVKAAGGIPGEVTCKAMMDIGVERFGMGYNKAVKMFERLGEE